MGEWLSLMEYATRNSVSLSTLRRQIKSGKLQARSEQGRYLIWHSTSNGVVASPVASLVSNDGNQVESLQFQLRKAREEIAELKTLLAFYEEQSPSEGYGSGFSV